MAGPCEFWTRPRADPAADRAERQAASRWWWQRPAVVARAAHGVPAFVRPPASPQRAGATGCSDTGADTTGRTNGRTTPSLSRTARTGAGAVRTGAVVAGAGIAATNGR